MCGAEPARDTACPTGPELGGRAGPLRRALSAGRPVLVPSPARPAGQHDLSREARCRRQPLRTRARRGRRPRPPEHVPRPRRRPLPAGSTPLAAPARPLKPSPKELGGSVPVAAKHLRGLMDRSVRGRGRGRHTLTRRGRRGWGRAGMGGPGAAESGKPPARRGRRYLPKPGAEERGRGQRPASRRRSRTSDVCSLVATQPQAPPGDLPPTRSEAGAGQSARGVRRRGRGRPEAACAASPAPGRQPAATGVPAAGRSSTVGLLCLPSRQGPGRAPWPSQISSCILM